ncbi:MAG: ABC transporter permease [Oscillospiraceae bacterium]|nr:ABC transporter permease [Oscillospiraceae bacterium]
MTKKRRERLERAADLRLESQIGEEEGFWALMRRMARENKIAVISFAVIVLMILAASLAPFLTPYEENDMDLLHRLSPPSAEHLLGTDEGGRDVLTRLLFGARVSLLIGVVPALLSLLLGSVLGVLAGYRGGLIDTVVMRLADVTLAFPSMLLAMVIMYSLGGGIVDVFLTLTLVNWANVARVVRAQTLQLKSSEYVEAARVIGVSRGTVMRRHILPNCLPTMLVLFTLNVPASILTESSLSFLGLGVQPPNASWGLMINTGRQYLYTAPWLCFAPGAAIMLIVLAFNFLGNGLLDVLDPRLKKQ